MYIINPWFFYFVEVIPKIGTTLFIVSLIAIVACALNLVDHLEKGTSIDSNKNHLLFFVIMMIISILFPEEETIYKMGIASITTTENVKIAVTESKELYNFLKDEIADAAKFIIDYQNEEGEKNDKNWEYRSV